MTRSELVSLLHARLPMTVVAITGGGSGVLGDLLSIPGGSRWLLEAVVPYSADSLAEFLGGRPAQACSVETAAALAQRAAQRARWLAPVAPVLGVGVTASLASDRPKKGDHRIHIAARTDQHEQIWSVSLAKGARDRAAEEELCAGLILHALAESMGIALPPAQLLPEETLARRRLDFPEVHLGTRLLHVTGDGRVEIAPPPVRAEAILPGAFNPLHRGHWALAEAARAFLDRNVAFELSAVNVDKAELGPLEVRRRLEQFAGKAEVYVSRAARFVEKAELFPGTVFVVGVDTAKRLVDLRYYERGESGLAEALAFFRAQACSFLVACREDAAGNCLTVRSLLIPAEFADLFRPLPEELFRLQVSSSEIREARLSS